MNKGLEHQIKKDSESTDPGSLHSMAHPAGFEPATPGTGSRVCR
jgi:hypothetical protein